MQPTQSTREVAAAAESSDESSVVSIHFPYGIFHFDDCSLNNFMPEKEYLVWIENEIKKEWMTGIFVKQQEQSKQLVFKFDNHDLCGEQCVPRLWVVRNDFSNVVKPGDECSAYGHSGVLIEDSAGDCSKKKKKINWRDTYMLCV